MAKRHQNKTVTNFVLSPLSRILVMTSAKAVRPLSLEEYPALEREALTPWPGPATDTTGWW